LLYALVTAGIGYGANLAFSGQMPEDKYFKGKNMIPAPKILTISIPTPEEKIGDASPVAEPQNKDSSAK
jgi:hypothetical protein